ncbi:Rho GTPase-activating protein 20 [Dissostichus eleginoides]|uniref:Rho GTPase-activating protein 20 n=1 Tax=Dissostichus eleginoides TaxID=100907 RepID=A0AAD9CJ51_DISEL|nr:Rho GTPase-activating protein 20 [Dissostichus eleginoides]
MSIVLMESMSPQQGTMGQNRSDSLTGEGKALPDNKKKMKTLAQRRQSAPSLVISKALTRSRSTSRKSTVLLTRCRASTKVAMYGGPAKDSIYQHHMMYNGAISCSSVRFKGRPAQLSISHSGGRDLLSACEGENCLTPVSPESCPLVQAFLAECPRRLFLGHIQTQLKTGLQTQERHLFLFTDTLLVAKAKSSTHFKVKAQVRVCEMWTASCLEEVCEGSTNPERSFVMGWPTCNCVASFSRILEGKDKDDPKTIPLKIFAKDIGNYAYAKTLSVSNTDSTSDVIRMALLQFGISGCEKDHRLWVSSSKDDPPYPLIGHEFPFSIKMSHIRDGGCSVGGAGRDPSTPTDSPGVLLLDQCLPPDTQCQFILKHSKVTPGQTSLIEPDHGLPKPVMDMLVFLFLEGPYTRGIFRRSAGAKACRELRDRVDSGSEDPEITHQSVFVIAAVLKDFLRNIPGSLLCVDLYEQWMDVMEGEAGEERTQAVQRLLQLLPSDNLLLLRHVIAVLHCIQGNAHDNQMNAFNLSVCIAPSMLGAPAPSTPEMEGEGTKKVCELVRLLIENCTVVLGEDVTSLFRNFSQKSSSSDHGSGETERQRGVKGDE